MAASSVSALDDLNTVDVSEGVKPTKTVRVDLSLEPRKRWKEVVVPQRKKIQKLARDFVASIDTSCEDDETYESPDEFINSLCVALFCDLQSHGLEDYIEELKGIADIIGISVSSVVLLHLAYELLCGCTSLICFSPSGQPYLGRTLDWDLDPLRALTVNIMFTRGEEELFSAVGWVGYIGVLTGVKTGAFGIAVNFREDSSEPSSSPSKGIPIGLGVRATFEKIQNYNEAVDYLASVELMAPGFLSIVDGSGSQGCVITRNPVGEVKRRTLATEKEEKPKRKRKRKRKRGQEEKVETTQKENYLIQTNMDHWLAKKGEDVMESLCRIQFADSFLEEVSSSACEEPLVLAEKDMWKFLLSYPIFDLDTIHITILSPHSGKMETTVITLEKKERERKRLKKMAKQLSKKSHKHHPKIPFSLKGKKGH